LINIIRYMCKLCLVTFSGIFYEFHKADQHIALPLSALGLYFMLQNDRNATKSVFFFKLHASRWAKNQLYEKCTKNLRKLQMFTFQVIIFHFFSTCNKWLISQYLIITMFFRLYNMTIYAVKCIFAYFDIYLVISVDLKCSLWNYFTS
jgi:hypothetical protein